jgi:hypothetical protein
MSENRSSYNTTVKDYFTRFDRALQLSKIPEEQYADYALMYAGSELNAALKFLVSPREADQ